MVDSEWAINVLSSIRPDHRFFGKSYVPEGLELRNMANFPKAQVDNADGFFTGLPTLKGKKKGKMPGQILKSMKMVNDLEVGDHMPDYAPEIQQLRSQLAESELKNKQLKVAAARMKQSGWSKDSAGQKQEFIDSTKCSTENSSGVKYNDFGQSQKGLFNVSSFNLDQQSTRVSDAGRPQQRQFNVFDDKKQTWTFSSSNQPGPQFTTEPSPGAEDGKSLGERHGAEDEASHRERHGAEEGSPDKQMEADEGKIAD